METEGNLGTSLLGYIVYYAECDFEWSDKAETTTPS